MNSHDGNSIKNRWRWPAYTAMLLAGFVAGLFFSSTILQSAPERIKFSENQAPTLMMHPLGRDGAYVHTIGNWELLTSLTSGNDSIALKYNNQFVATLATASDRSLESMVINHPRHNTVLLILENLNAKKHPGKLTTDILSPDGNKMGFVIDENIDGQPDLRFEYAGPYLYAWLDDSWHRVMRASPRQTGHGFKHTVMYREKLHQIYLEQYPYKLEPLNSGE